MKLSSKLLTAMTLIVVLGAYSAFLILSGFSPAGLPLVLGYMLLGGMLLPTSYSMKSNDL